MPLIVTDKHTPEDLEAWWQRERIDRVNCLRGTIDRKERKALTVIEGWLAAGESSVSCSWGKDSVVVAHLARRVDPSIRVWWAKKGDRPGRRNNPEVTLVRDAWLKQWPDTTYIEYDADPELTGGGQQLARVNRLWEPRTITGVRADESVDRSMSANVHGVTTKRFCRPILRWAADDVFAYHYRHDIPTHPAYGYSMGGELERRHLRVGLIGGTRGVNMGRRVWEGRYYPVELAAAVAEQEIS